MFQIKFKFSIILLGIFINISVLSCSVDEEGIGDIISRYFDTENIVNIPVFELNYGPERMNFGSTFNSTFEENYSTEIQYGFLRFDKELSQNGLLYFSSERVFFGNSSSRFKIPRVSDNTIKTDMYRYGGLYNNGFGYGDANGSKILFSHSSSIFWTESDIENFANNDNDNRLLYGFEKENNFGMSYSTGIIYTLDKGNTSLEFKYQHNVVWTDFYFTDWFGSWLLENLIQRTPDLFNDFFIRQFGVYYPIIYQFYKTAISYIIYEGRSNNSYFPFGNTEVLTQRSFRLGIKFSL